MPEDLSLYNNSINVVNWTGEIIDVVSSKYLTFTAYSDQNYDITVEWSISSDFLNIIDVDVCSVVGTRETLHLPVKAKYTRIQVDVSSTPNVFYSNGFFFS